MEYANGMFVNYIIHYFKQSAVGIKSKKQVLIVAVINLFFKNKISDGMSNILFIDTMLKGGLIELNVVFKHILNLIQPVQNRKHRSNCFNISRTKGRQEEINHRKHGVPRSFEPIPPGRNILQKLL